MVNLVCGLFQILNKCYCFEIFDQQDNPNHIFIAMILWHLVSELSSELISHLYTRALYLEEPILMHDPISFDTFKRPSTIKDEGFLDANFLSSISGRNSLFSSRRHLIPRNRRPIRPRPIRIFPLSRNKKDIILAS